MQLSIVTTLYRSAPYLAEFHRRVSEAARRLTANYEIIFINDGSPDDSQHVAEALCDADPRCRVVELSRNFGHHKAMMTGLAHARGERVFLIDCDLEEPPEVLADMARIQEEQDADVVYGVQQQRAGSWFRKATGWLHYTLLDWLSEHPIPRNVCTVRLMRREYVAALLQCGERDMVISGLWQYVGFRQVPHTIQRVQKEQSNYTLLKKIRLVVSTMTAFSTAPLKLIFYIGTFILGSAGLWIAYLILIRLFLGKPPDGYTSLMVSIWFLGGLILFSIGIVAIYLSTVIQETKRRPYTLVRSAYQREEEPAVVEKAA
jgi:putative glycosyltransferase